MILRIAAEIVGEEDEDIGLALGLAGVEGGGGDGEEEQRKREAKHETLQNGWKKRICIQH